MIRSILLLPQIKEFYNKKDQWLVWRKCIVMGNWLNNWMTRRFFHLSLIITIFYKLILILFDTITWKLLHFFLQVQIWVSRKCCKLNFDTNFILDMLSTSQLSHARNWVACFNVFHVHNRWNIIHCCIPVEKNSHISGVVTGWLFANKSTDALI